MSGIIFVDPQQRVKDRLSFAGAFQELRNEGALEHAYGVLEERFQLADLGDFIAENVTEPDADFFFSFDEKCHSGHGLNMIVMSRIFS